MDMAEGEDDETASQEDMDDGMTGGEVEQVTPEDKTSFSSVADNEPEGDVEASKEVVKVMLIIVFVSIAVAVITVLSVHYCAKKGDQAPAAPATQASNKPQVTTQDEGQIPESARGLTEQKNKGGEQI